MDPPRRHDAIAGRYCIATRRVQTDNVRPVHSKFIYPLFEPLNPFVENCADRDLTLTSIYRAVRQRSQPGSAVSKHCGSKVRRRLQRLLTNSPSCQHYVVFCPQNARPPTTTTEDCGRVVQSQRRAGGLQGSRRVPGDQQEAAARRRRVCEEDRRRVCIQGEGWSGRQGGDVVGGCQERQRMRAQRHRQESGLHHCHV